MATTTVTVNVAESQNYLATSRTISVNCSAKDVGYITLSTNSVSLNGWAGVTQTVTITSNSGGALSVASSDSTKVTASLSGTTITLTGVASGNATITVTVGETSTHTSATATISVAVTIRTMQYGLYGITWTSNVAKGTRTDDAANLADPQPCLNSGRDGSGSSPFDYIYPWGAMRYVEVTCTDFNVAGVFDKDVFVEIPKFWYQMSFNSSGYPTVKISSTQRSGYSVSPAHRNRDGLGERDYVYILKSSTGYRGSSSSIDSYRSYIDDDYGTYGHQYDYAMHITLFLLMLVEMGYTEMGTPMGLGRGQDNTTWQYHTGTSASSRDVQGGLRYRHIFGLWGYVTPIDGYFVKEGKLYAIDNPNDYLDGTNSRLVGNISVPSNDIYGGLRFAFSGQNDDYFLECNDTIHNNVFTHSSYKMYDTTSMSNLWFVFRTLGNYGDGYNKFAPLFSVTLCRHDNTPSSGSGVYDGYSGCRCVFTPPNNYSHITSIREV